MSDREHSYKEIEWFGVLQLIWRGVGCDSLWMHEEGETRYVFCESWLQTLSLMMSVRCRHELSSTTLSSALNAVT